MTEQAEKDKGSFENLIDNAKSAKSTETYTINSPTGASWTDFLPANNIRKASNAVWEMVESDAISARDKLKNLTGDAYTSAFNDAIQGIATRVQAATKATDKEMDGFKSSITEYLSEIVQWGKNHKRK